MRDAYKFRRSLSLWIVWALSMRELIMGGWWLRRYFGNDEISMDVSHFPDGFVEEKPAGCALNDFNRPKNVGVLRGIFCFSSIQILL